MKIFCDLVSFFPKFSSCSGKLHVSQYDNSIDGRLLPKLADLRVPLRLRPVERLTPELMLVCVELSLIRVNNCCSDACSSPRDGQQSALSRPYRISLTVQHTHTHTQNLEY